MKENSYNVKIENINMGEYIDIKVSGINKKDAIRKALTIYRKHYEGFFGTEYYTEYNIVSCNKAE